MWTALPITKNSSFYLDACYLKNNFKLRAIGFGNDKNWPHGLSLVFKNKKYAIEKILVYRL